MTCSVSLLWGWEKDRQFGVQRKSGFVRWGWSYKELTRVGWKAGDFHQTEVVPKRGVEPLRSDDHMALNHARLPVPPLRLRLLILLASLFVNSIFPTIPLILFARGQAIPSLDPPYVISRKSFPLGSGIPLTCPHKRPELG